MQPFDPNVTPDPDFLEKLARADRRQEIVKTPARPNWWQRLRRLLRR
ncbi:MAG TPA: hypothetical protein VMU59_01035 [Caulobacteraceae bacterium]|nr:hypothetical protein [Caulobacteraceae bacterium]